MGRRRVTRKNKGGLSRRSFLKGAGAASALLATQPFLGAGAQDDDVSSSAAAGSSPFHHGVASGDPRSERVMLWTRVTLAAPPDSIPVTYVVATDTALANIVTSGTASADAAHDYTVKVDVAGLSPGTTYYYRFSANGMDSQIGRTRTLPVGSVDRLRIAVLSCASLAHGYFNAYRCVAHRADLDLVVHLGDYIYEYGDGDYGSARNYQPPHEIITLHDYRTRHNQYKRDPDVKALHRQHPVVAIWDDHEFADNAWLGGAANHQPDTEGAWTDRVNAAVQAYYEWMPIRPPASGDIRNIYRSFRIGDLAELFMLEERITARDQQLDSNLPGGTSLFTESGAYLDTSRHMISNTQQNWLLNHMHQSTAQWKLIGQGVVMAPVRVGSENGKNVFFNSDQWDGYKPARTRLLKAIAGTSTGVPVNNAVVLTGDIHSSWAADLPLEPYGANYNPSTGAGSLAVELVGTSVTSPGFDDLNGYSADGLQSVNPHLKYVELTQRGYLLLDINSQRVSGEWWYVNTIDTRDDTQSFATALQTSDQANHLEPGAQSPPKPHAPPLAPA